jgi:hypothetical protein
MAYIQVHEEEFFFCPNSGHTGQPMAELFPLDVPFDSMNFDVCIAITGLIWAVLGGIEENKHWNTISSSCAVSRACSEVLEPPDMLTAT